MADSEFVIPTREEAARVNENTVGVVFTHEELFHQLVHNLEDELELESDLRIVPIMGKNHVQSVYDLLYLRGVDLALLRSDALEYVRRKGDMGSVLRITHSVAKLADEKIVIIASTDYDSVDELDGQVVGFGLAGSGEFVTGTIVFESAGIEPVALEVEESSAIERVKSGELAAMIYLLRAPDAIQIGAALEAREAVAELDAEDDLHVLALPRSEALSAIYRPATLTHEELPLVPEGETIPTYSVDVILAAYNWREPNARQAKKERFIDALVDGLDALQSEVYQPAWQRVDLSVETPNVTSAPYVARALEMRETERLRREEAARIAAEQAAAREKAERTAELMRKRDELTSRLGQELNEADTVELERMLEELDSFLADTAENEATSADEPAEAADAGNDAEDTASEAGGGTVAEESGGDGEPGGDASDGARPSMAGTEDASGANAAASDTEADEGKTSTQAPSAQAATPVDEARLDDETSGGEGAGDTGTVTDEGSGTTETGSGTSESMDEAASESTSGSTSEAASESMDQQSTTESTTESTAVEAEVEREGTSATD